MILLSRPAKMTARHPKHPWNKPNLMVLGSPSEGCVSTEDATTASDSSLGSCLTSRNQGRGFDWNI